jgi:hypothetical protein
LYYCDTTKRIGGVCYCLQEAKIALVRLYQDQTYKLQPGQVPLALQQNITLSPCNGVWVTVEPRS